MNLSALLFFQVVDEVDNKLFLCKFFLKREQKSFKFFVERGFCFSKVQLRFLMSYYLVERDTRE